MYGQRDRHPCGKAGYPFRGLQNRFPKGRASSSARSPWASLRACRCGVSWPSIDERQVSGRTPIPGYHAESGVCLYPEGNGLAERFIRALKELLVWVRTFQMVEEVRELFLNWLLLYNDLWVVERYGFRLPSLVRRDLLVEPEAA
ncbi:MAG: hypothetical protein KF751_12445 [Nitrospira sp.]|nr:hypothetical protein [Nitrospira sp.]